MRAGALPSFSKYKSLGNDKDEVEEVTLIDRASVYYGLDGDDKDTLVP